jgi:hypothetical protein
MNELVLPTLSPAADCADPVVESAHKEVVDAAERGDPAPVRKFMKEFGCSPYVSPAASSPSAGS